MKLNIDKGFKPLIVELEKFERQTKDSGVILTICVERNDGYNYIHKMNIFKDGINDDLNYLMAERILKFILWAMGGYKVYIAGSKIVGNRIKKAYKSGGERGFDANFMQRVYEQPFEVLVCNDNEIPVKKSQNLQVGGNFEGCRIGFDAGGSDRKVSAVIDGKAVYSEEVIWHPKLQSDPNYHYNEIMTAMQTAASKMPRVDAIGVSSAGIYVNNRIMVASLFIKVEDEKLFDKKVKNMYIDIANKLGVKAIDVVNDGDVTALAGAMELKDDSVLGIAMGTSQAGGYINSNGGINGWLNELAFTPIDLSKDAMQDEWSGDFGCGVKYFSQDGVIKLAKLGGFKFEENLTPAQKLKVIQDLHEEGDRLAESIFEDIGTYLAYSLPLYAKFYDIKHVLLLGRVTSKRGGEVMLKKAKQVLAEKFPNLSHINITMPDESNRRVGQSIAAASLAKI